MARFQYKGRTQRGDPIEGIIEANDADAVATQLFNSGITPIDINPASDAGDTLGLQAIWERFWERKPKLDDLVLFTRQMYALTHAGVPIIRAINGLAENTRNVYFARILRDVADNLEAGRDLAGAFARHGEVFTPLFVSMVQVGESTGRLDDAFLKLSSYLEREKETRDRIKSALRYPLIVIVAIVAAMFVINLKVIPAFADVYKNMGSELPLPTRILIGMSDFMVAYWFYIAVVMAASIAGIIAYVRTEKGRYKWHKMKLRLPVVGDIIKRATLARFARSFSMAYRAGVPLIQSLGVVSRTLENDYIADRIQIMRNGIERGEGLTQTAVATGMFTPLVIQMFSVGEETGAVDDMMDEVADFYEREVDYDLRTLSDAIEPILIVAIGVMVLILALGVFLPMWEMANAAKGG